MKFTRFSILICLEKDECSYKIMIIVVEAEE